MSISRSFSTAVADTSLASLISLASNNIRRDIDCCMAKKSRNCSCRTQSIGNANVEVCQWYLLDSHCTDARVRWGWGDRLAECPNILKEWMEISPRNILMYFYWAG